ncbi:DNA-processing protein DprA [Lutimaribacter sp. EGI FJ00015]|uniref:DNA-processing protein DprA n=1 Tax=Lutimaribacter degradans TaxID=2945989 RepID=A0ACC5ZR64_9RHOB|nr:DNA-processing protein DprA [Lutimaribacter sp. EGI FJ00013]MCM2560625.1 DNA-processing protein DprA [Lutimaribacter sp. EGI FJ00013]MCO0612432.1 DNA-processing protein DprA [Lutimaribacter sp. EGI FJ00015]MCO0634449.1 DNA-processing protein DprA [Lutimaribacter sp. EGI FJ00014]
MPEEFHPSTHPPLPPTTEDERVSWLRLLRSRRVGPSTFYRLLHEHGSTAAALDALPGVARAAGVESYTPCPPEVAQAELRKARGADAQMLCVGANDYPAALLDLPDPPPILWALGDTGLLTRDRIAMVGARNASSLGTRMARALALDLAKQGFVIVSGLARGVDTAAHLAALGTGTIAVMAGGVDVIYPAENTQLAENIARTGLRLSEQPMGVAPQARHFPRRNRLISGLARGVVVVEAAAKSGSLITARDALDQGREVMAVPGHPFDARAAGCNMLIRDGATLVRRAEDVMEALPAQNAPAPPRAQPDRAGTPTIPDPAPERRSLQETAALHSQILDRLGPSPLAEDQLIRDLRAPAQAVAPALTDLELDGRIIRHPGGLLARAT